MWRSNMEPTNARRMAALNKENGRLCMKFAEARCIAVDALKDAKTTR